MVERRKTDGHCVGHGSQGSCSPNNQANFPSERKNKTQNCVFLSSKHLVFLFCVDGGSMLCQLLELSMQTRPFVSLVVVVLFLYLKTFHLFSWTNSSHYNSDDSCSLLSLSSGPASFSSGTRRREDHYERIGGLAQLFCWLQQTRGGRFLSSPNTTAQLVPSLFLLIPYWYEWPLRSCWCLYMSYTVSLLHSPRSPGNCIHWHDVFSLVLSLYNRRGHDNAHSYNYNV